MQAWTSQKCSLCKQQVVRFHRSRVQCCWQHGLVERDLSSARNIWNKARAVITGDGSADYLADSRAHADWKQLVITRNARARIMSRADFQAAWERVPLLERVQGNAVLKALVQQLCNGELVLEKEVSVLPGLSRTAMEAHKFAKARHADNLTARDALPARQTLKHAYHGARGGEPAIAAWAANEARRRRVKPRPLLRLVPAAARARYGIRTAAASVAVAPAVDAAAGAPFNEDVHASRTHGTVSEITGQAHGAAPLTSEV